MIPAFILANPPKKVRRNKMAKRRSAPKSSWQSLASSMMKKYGGTAGLKKAQAIYRARPNKSKARKTSAKRARRNPAKSNPYFRYQVPSSVAANPYFKYGMPASVSYNPYVKSHKRKGTKVARHYRKSAKRNPARRNYFRYRAGSAVANQPDSPLRSAMAAAGPRTSVQSVQKIGTGFLKAFTTKGFLIQIGSFSLGFLGTKLIAGMVMRNYEPKPEDSAELIAKKRERLAIIDKYRAALYLGGGLSLGLGVGLFTRNAQWAVGLATGGIFAAIQTVCERFEWYQAWFSLPPIVDETKAGLGALSTTAKDKIAKLVEAEVAREAASMSGLGRGMGAYVTESEIRTPVGMSGMDAFATESELRRPETGPGASSVAGVSMDEFLAGPDMGL